MDENIFTKGSVIERQAGKIGVKYIIRQIEEEIKEGKAKDKSYLMIDGKRVSNTDALKILKEYLKNGIEVIEVSGDKNE